MVETKQCNWTSRFVGINETNSCVYESSEIYFINVLKLLIRTVWWLWVCIRVPLSPPPFAILDHLIFVVFLSVYEYSEIYFVRVLNEHGCVLERPPSLSPCDSRPSNFCALFIFYCVRKCQQGIGKIGIIFLYLRNNSNPNHLKVENWLLFWPSAFSRGQIVFLTSFWLHANCYAWRIT